MRFLGDAAAVALVDWESAIRCMKEAYSEDLPKGAVPGRLIASAEGGWIRCMPGIRSRGNLMGTKQISRTRGGRIAHLITLFDKDTGELAFIIDGISLTGVRTAATSASAMALLSGDGATDLAILGSGLEAHKHLEAIASFRRISSLRIFSPTAENRDSFASESSARYGITARAVATPQEAVVGATHVVAAARARGEQPILYGDWLASEVVVISVGSTIPIQREVDVSVIERASIIVADVPEEVAHETGDMIAAAKAGISFRDKLVSLHDLVQGRVPRPRRLEGVRLFKSVGSALQDLAIAEFVAGKATQENAGTTPRIELNIRQSLGR